MKKLLTPIGFWLVSLTWGSIMTLIGAFAALGLLITGHKPKLYKHYVWFEVGENWGGVNLGGFIITSKNSAESTIKHEAGHGIQNIIFGPFQVFIGIASAIRYHYYMYNRKKGTEHLLPPYDSVWFENQATKFGEKYFSAN